MNKRSAIQQSWFFYLLALLTCLPTLLFMARYGWLGDPRFFNDATAFYCAGQHFWQGGVNPYDYPTQLACSQGYGRTFSLFFYPPNVLPVFGLWSLLLYKPAMLGLLALSVIALGYIYCALFQLYLDGMGRLQWLVVVWLAFSQLAFIQLPFGQINFIAMALCMLLARSLLQGMPIMAGYALAFIVAVKTPFAVLGLLPLVQRQWRVLLYAGAIVYLSLLVVVLMRDFTQLYDWFKTGMEYASYAGLVSAGHPDILQRDNVSLFAALYRWIGFDAAIIAMSFIAPLLLGVAVIRIWLLRDLAVPVLTRFALATLPATAYLLSSLTWRAYFIFLLPLIFWLLRECLLKTKYVPAVLAVMLIMAHEIGHILPVVYVNVPTVTVILALAYMLSRKREQLS